MSAFIELDEFVAVGMEDQRGYIQLLRQRRDVNSIQYIADRYGIRWGGGEARKFIQAVLLFARALRNEHGGEHLPERGIVAGPSETNDVDEGLCHIAMLRHELLMQPAACISTKKDKVRDAFGIA